MARTLIRGAKPLTIALCASFLMTAAIVARASEYSRIEQRCAQLDHLNDAAEKIISTGFPDAARLSTALRDLQQTMASISQLQSTVTTDANFVAVVGDLHRDNLRHQAEAYARLGDDQAALGRLEAFVADGASAGDEQWLVNDKYFARLHGDPRFKALVSRFDSLQNQWDAAAFMTPTQPLREAQRIAGLSLFWSEARYNFANFDQVPQLDWNQAYLTFLPKVVAARSLHDYYDVLMRFAPLLRDAHTNVYPPKALEDQFIARPPIRTALVQNHVLIVEVGDPGLAGGRLHVGDEILTVNGMEVHRYVEERVQPYVSASTPDYLALRAYSDYLLKGDRAQPVSLRIENASHAQFTVTLSREPDPAAKWSPDFEFRTLPDGIAYLSLGEFGDDLGVRMLEQHLPQILQAKGLILDMRSNDGGDTDNGLSILSWLTHKPIPGIILRSRDYVPTWRAWNGPSDQWKTMCCSDPYTQAHARIFTGPVAVLIGGRTISAGEDFVISYLAMKRGILVGQTTAGSSGQPLIFSLPGGGTARICSARETFPDGRKFIGIGIPPQIRVEPTVEDIRAGRDPVIAAAAKALLQR